MLGFHSLVDLDNCNRKRLMSGTRLLSLLVEAVLAIGAKNIDSRIYKHKDEWITVIVILEESHMILHAWPKYRKACLDIFTCGDISDHEPAIAVVSDGLGSTAGRRAETRRGEDAPTGEGLC